MVCTMLINWLKSNNYSYKLLFEVFLCSSLLLFYFCLSYVFLKLFLAVYYFFTDGMKEFLDVFFELGLVGRR